MKTLAFALLTSLVLLLPSPEVRASSEPDYYETRCDGDGCTLYECSYIFGCRPVFRDYRKEN